MATTTTQDDAFREIQLNGKQLVFLFMAVTVIAVVIFLFGVLVGRGVRNERGLPTPNAEGAVASSQAAIPPPPPGSAASDKPVTGSEQLGYAQRLGNQPAAEQLQKAEPPAPAEEESAAKASAKAPAEKPNAAVAKPAETPKPAPTPAQPASASAKASAGQAPAAPATEPSGAGFAIQVAATKERAEADTMVKRLAAKGYPAYVLAPAAGAPPMFRVRIGKYTDRREADTVAARLQKEEQFKPWVVR